jgi:mono/diheme cytochrome c family protein
MRKVFKWGLWLLIGVVIVIASGLTYVSYALPNIGPPSEMEVEITPERVERGEYLAWNVVLCIDCHSKRDFSIFSGPPIQETIAAGGEIFNREMGFPGVFLSRNITPYGIGDWTDGELFRLITTGVKRDGEPIFPVMPYHNYGQLDPEDIKAIIAYVRSLEPVEADHAASQVDFPFNFILRTIPKEANMQQRPDKSDKVAYGKYMFTAAACAECHTKFEKGDFIGPLCGGGRSFQFPDGSILSSANITFHETGIKSWTKETFIEKFKMYEDSSYVPQKVNPGEFQTIMPWMMYAGMTEEDLGAIYDYLETLPPADNPVEKFVTAE